jgi:hypothetical protein
MNEQNENIRVKESLSPDQVETILMNEADSLDLIEQDTQNTTTLTDEDRADVIEQVNAEHHQVFLSMNAIRGVDVDAFCSNEKSKKGDYS